MSQNASLDAGSSEPAAKNKFARGCLGGLYRNAVLILVVLIIAGVLFSLARAAVYKIRPYERGLHLRGGRFLGIDQPGWHIQIPFVDTVIGVNIVERPGSIDKLAAMTADDVTLDISMLYTYRVVDPVRYALEVTYPDQIVAGFAQGTLRDIVNTQNMDTVMHSRAEINQQVITALQKKEQQYGVEFVLVQIQSASPPEEVLTAIKDRMVAVQLEEKSSAEASQKRTLADSEYYAAQKKADGEAYQITTLAKADAERINLTSQSKVEALQAILKELQGKGTLAEQYIQVLIAQELAQNSKWVISNGGAMPIVDLRGTVPEVQPSPTPAP
jgi:regulator of protease activity HflC (stomatin/prohibitin superfamily)